jgi:hypothetical protein
VLKWWWLYDGPEVAHDLRTEYWRLQQETRHCLADLCAAGADDADLRRAQELYIGLTGGLAEYEQLWAGFSDIRLGSGDGVG